jgi:hypothetical protein
MVNASDEILVAGVRVMVHDEQGQLLESGDAVKQQKDWWGGPSTNPSTRPRKSSHECTKNAFEYSCNIRGW